MLQINNPLISKYEKRNSKVCVNISLADELENFKNGKYKIQIEQCRKALHEEGKIGYDRLKSQLSGVTFCGTFNDVRQADKIFSYNKFLIIDIDDLESDTINEIKNLIKEDVFTYSVFLSPSGKGLKILVKIETEVELHKLAFRAITKYYFDRFSINIDLSGSDCSRLCYVSWDSNLHVNVDAQVFTYDLIETENIVVKTDKKNKDAKPRKTYNVGNIINLKNSYGLNKDSDRIMMKKIITFLKKNNKTITASHNKWYKCAYSIANTFSYDLGLKYFLNLAELDGVGYDEYKSRERIMYCYLNKKDEGGVHFATIIAFAKEEGFVTSMRSKN